MRSWRQARGKTDPVFAADMGFSLSTLQSKEAGVLRLSVADLFKACRLLAVRPRDLFGEDTIAPRAARR